MQKSGTEGYRCQPVTPNAIIPLYSRASLISGRLFGSLLSWVVLQVDVKNVTMQRPEETKYCGADDCPWLNTTNVFYAQPPIEKVRFSVFLDEAEEDGFPDKISRYTITQRCSRMVRIFSAIEIVHQSLLFPVHLAMHFVSGVDIGRLLRGYWHSRHCDLHGLSG